MQDAKKSTSIPEPPPADEPSHGTLDVTPPETENRPSTDAIAPPVIVTENEVTKSPSNLWLYLGIGILLGIFAIAYFIRKKDAYSKN